jgi:outer membrane protein
MRRVPSFIFLPSTLAVFLLTGCSDYKGASQPFTYAPTTAASLWIPPSCIRTDAIVLDEINTDKLKEKSLSLGEVLDIALHNNPQTKRTWAKARSAAASYGQSLKNYYVLADLTSDYMNYQEALFTSTNTSNVITNVSNTNESSSYFSGNTFHGVTYGAQAELTYTVLDFGQTRATSKAALAALYEADFLHNNELQKTVNTTMNDYYVYLAQKAKLTAAEQNVKNAQVALDAVLERFKYGLADVSDKVQATTKLLEEKLALVSEKKQLTYSYTSLLSSMGFPANAYLTFENYPDKLQLYDIIDLSSLIEIASSKRQDLQAAYQTVAMTEQKLKSAQAQRYPKVNASFEVGRERANLGIGSYNDYMLSLNLNFPLFHGFFIENGIKKAKADTEEAKAKLQHIQLSVVQEITNTFHDVSYAKESYLYSKQYLESAEEDFKVNLEQYKAGLNTIVDLINAQAAVSSAKAKFIEAQKGWYSSIANLSYSTGTLTCSLPLLPKTAPDCNF